MTDERPISDEPDATAAEHALRLLTGDELRAAEARAASEPGFAAEVARWRGRLAPLADEIEETSPPRGIVGEDCRGDRNRAPGER